MTNSPNPLHLRGQWLRQRRTELGLNARVVSKALKLSSQLSPIELYNLFIPPAWGPVLKQLGVIDADTWPEANTGMSGHDLRAWRKRVFVREDYLADVLRVHLVALQLVEGRNWPIPPEWLPILQELMAISLNPTPRIPPAWDVRNRVVQRVKEGVPIEKVASTSGMEVEVVRLWVHLADMREQKARGFPTIADPDCEDISKDAPKVDEPSPPASPALLPKEASYLILMVPLEEPQIRALNRLAQVFPARSAGVLAAKVIDQFLRSQASVVEGLDRIASLGESSP